MMLTNNIRVFFLVTFEFLCALTFELPYETTGISVDLYTQYSSPFGGQGFHMSSDAFPPYGVVELRTNVICQSDDVAGKPVLYTIESPNGKEYFAIGYTQANGVAVLKHPIPDSEDYFGEWFVNASVDFGGTTVCDTLHFLVGWLVEMTEIDTTPVACKGETMSLNVTLARICIQDPRAIMDMLVKDSSGNPTTDNDLLMLITVIDELNQPLLTSKLEMSIDSEPGFYDLNEFVVNIGERWIDRVNVILTQYSALAKVVMGSIPISPCSFSGRAVVCASLFTGVPGIAYCPECLGHFWITLQTDIDRNGEVNIADVAKMAQAFGTECVEIDGVYWHYPPCRYCPHDPTLDLNNDGHIDIFEVVLLAQNFGETW